MLAQLKKLVLVKAFDKTNKIEKLPNGISGKGGGVRKTFILF